MSDLPVLTGGEAKTLEASRNYDGEISSVEVRDTERWGEYLDIEIKIDGLDVTLTPSYAVPENELTPGHDLGALVERMMGNESIDPGTEYDLNDIFQVGTRVSVYTEEGDEGYINAVKDSLRPAGEAYNDSDSGQASEPDEDDASGVSFALRNALEKYDAGDVSENEVIGDLVKEENQDMVNQFTEAVEQGHIDVADDGTVVAFPDAE